MGCSTSREPTQPPAAAASAHLQERLEQHEGGINCMALSEDNSLLVSGSEDGRVLLWSTQSSPIELLGTLRGHSSYVTHCVVHGNYVVTGSADGTLKKWSIVDAKCVHTFEGHGARVNRVACTADLILSTSHDKTAAAWRFNADLELQELEERRLLRQVASCNKSAVSGPKERGSLGSNGENGEGNSSSYDGTSGDDDSDSESDSTSDRITVFRGHTKSVFPVIFVPADNMLGATKETEDIVITGSHDFTARTWGLYSGECLKVLKGHTAPINAMVVDTDGNILFTGGGDGVIRSWHIKTGDCQRVLTGHQGPIVSLIGHTKSVFPVIFVPADNMLGATKETEDIVITGSHDFTARTWGLYSGECLKVLKGHTAPINAMVVDTDGNILFTGGGDGVIRSWHIKTGDCQRVLTGHQGPIVSLIGRD
ncbi:WD repeat-containing protein 86 [Ixodes scapularis]